MESDNKTNDRPGVGALLRASRLRVGEDLRDVAANLCIRYLYLEAIEEGRYADLPGPTYAIGFVRAYAEHIGLDSDEVVRRFKQEIAGVQETV
ncbi:MAG TPA: helix-turn-helix domain-containing protein, partial [Rhodospirillales bacterium]|nr:helix-turn-helix domain-containing protein [Rhodospirillales bacterium]